MRHRSSLGSRAARSPRITPRGSARRRGLLGIAPARMLLGCLVTVGIAALLLAVPVVSGKVTAPPPAALEAPALGAQSTAGSVVVMGQDGAPVQAAPTPTGSPSAATTPAAPTSDAGSRGRASRVATSSSVARPASPTRLMAASSAAHPTSGGGSPTSGATPSSSSSAPTSSSSSSSAAASTTSALPTDTVPLPVDPTAISTPPPTP